MRDQNLAKNIGKVSVRYVFGIILVALGQGAVTFAFSMWLRPRAGMDPGSEEATICLSLLATIGMVLAGVVLLIMLGVTDLLVFLRRRICRKSSAYAGSSSYRLAAFASLTLTGVTLSFFLTAVASKLAEPISHFMFLVPGMLALLLGLIMTRGFWGKLGKAVISAVRVERPSSPAEKLH